MRSDCSLYPLRHFGRHCCCRQWGCGSFGLPGWVGDWADVYTSFRCGQVLAVREAGWACHRGRLPRWVGLHASVEGVHSMGQLHLEETRVPTNCCLSCCHPKHTHSHTHTHKIKIKCCSWSELSIEPRGVCVIHITYTLRSTLRIRNYRFVAVIDAATELATKRKTSRVYQCKR